MHSTTITLHDRSIAVGSSHTAIDTKKGLDYTYIIPQKTVQHFPTSIIRQKQYVHGDVRQLEDLCTIESEDIRWLDSICNAHLRQAMMQAMLHIGRCKLFVQRKESDIIIGVVGSRSIYAPPSRKIRGDKGVWESTIATYIITREMMRVYESMDLSHYVDGV